VSRKQKNPTAPTRDRILSAARHLFQQRGYYAVGTTEILERAQAPKGSMYHHFPDGKQQIAIEAVSRIRGDMLAMMRKLAIEQRSVAEIVRLLAKGMAAWLKQSRWREGTMLATATVGSVPDLPAVHTVIKGAFDEWRNYLTMLLTRERWTHSDARTMAQTIVAAIEGAMILARVDQDERVVLNVAESLISLLEPKLTMRVAKTIARR